MAINPSAPATAAGALQINADPQTVFSVLAAIDHLRTVLSRLKAEAERRAATA
jgi:hypothetical protein